MRCRESQTESDSSRGKLLSRTCETNKECFQNTVMGQAQDRQLHSKNKKQEREKESPCDGLNDEYRLRSLAFECLIPSGWCYLMKLGICGLVGGACVTGVDFPGSHFYSIFLMLPFKM